MIVTVVTTALPRLATSYRHVDTCYSDLDLWLLGCGVNPANLSISGDVLDRLRHRGCTMRLLDIGPPGVCLGRPCVLRLYYAARPDVFLLGER